MATKAIMQAITLILLLSTAPVEAQDNAQALVNQLRAGSLSTYSPSIVIPSYTNPPALNPYLLAEAQKSRYDALSAKEDVITGMLGGPSNPASSNGTARAIQRYWLNTEEYYARPNR